MPILSSILLEFLSNFAICWHMEILQSFTQNINWINILNGNCHDAFKRFDFVIHRISYSVQCLLWQRVGKQMLSILVNMIICHWARHFVAAKNEIGFSLIFFGITFKATFVKHIIHIYLLCIMRKGVPKYRMLITVANTCRNVFEKESFVFYSVILCHWLLLKIKSHTLFSKQNAQARARHHHYLLIFAYALCFSVRCLYFSALLWLLTLDLVYILWANWEFNG